MQKPCEICGGSGQVGHFQGVSRFVITWEECLECNGTGYLDEDDGSSPENDSVTPDENNNNTTASDKKLSR